MLKIDLIKSGNKTYAKGTDDKGNTYYYSPKKKIYLCFTKSGSVGVGRTIQEALEYAINNEHKSAGMGAAISRTL